MKFKKIKSIYKSKGIDFKAVDKKSKKFEAATARHAHKFLISRIENLRHIRRYLVAWLTLLILLICLNVAQIIFNQEYLNLNSPAKDGVYAEGVLGPVNNLNPLFASSDAEFSADRLIFSSLFQYDTNGRLQGDAALSYTVQDNGRKYVIDLRPDIKWHDGKKLTSDDVVFTVNMIKNPAVGSRQFSGWQNIKASASSPTQVAFTLPTNYAPFASAMTFPILPKHILEKVPPQSLRENDFSKKPVGSGLFKALNTQVVDINKEKSAVHLERNENHWSGKPDIAKFSIYAYKNRDDIAKGLKQREINAASGVLVSGRGLKTVNVPVNNGYFVMFKTDGAPLNDKSVRKALALATDRKEIRFQMGGKIPLEGPVINNQTPIASKVQQVKYNENLAKKTLKAAGWKKGNDGYLKKAGQTLELRIVSVDTATYRRLTKNVAEQWKQVGVKPIVQLIDPEQIQQVILRPRAYDVLVYELSMGGDPDAFAFWHSSQAKSSGLNFANFKSSVADDALITARGGSNIGIRDSKYASFAQAWVNEVPAIALYRTSLLYSTTKDTQSLDPEDMLVDPVDRYYNVADWASETDRVYNTP